MEKVKKRNSRAYKERGNTKSQIKAKETKETKESKVKEENPPR
jgi:hypothetical protein